MSELDDIAHESFKFKAQLDQHRESHMLLIEILRDLNDVKMALIAIMSGDNDQKAIAAKAILKTHKERNK